MSGVSSLDTVDIAGLVAQTIARLADELDVLDDLIVELVDRDALAVTLFGLRDMKSRAAEVYSHCEEQLLSEAGEKDFDVPNLGRFTVRKSTKRSAWKHDDLVRVLVRKSRDEEPRLLSRDGEVESEGEVVARVIRDCVSLGAGKVGGLKPRGIDIDEFCTVEAENWSVQLPPKKAL